MSATTQSTRRPLHVSYPAPATAEPPVVICAVADPHAERAVVETGAALADRLRGSLVLVHTQPPPLIAAEPLIAYVSPQPDPRRELHVTAQVLAQIATDAGAAGESRIHLGFGGAEKCLLDLAEREAARLIVVSSGAFTTRLRAHASCPVLVLPEERIANAAPTSRDWGREPMAVRRAARDRIAMTPRKERGVTRSILCGVDGSPDARLALRAAAQLSTQLDARLVVAHVVEVHVQPPRLGPTFTPMGDELEAGKKLLESVLKEERLRDLDRKVVVGVPADRLADLADEEAAELIVVGSRGRGAFKAAFLGSVSSDLIGVARCPVLVVPPGAAKERPDAAVAQWMNPEPLPVDGRRAIFGHRRHG
jgi:nucleotide-binding universal stress UspA family protein